MVIIGKAINQTVSNEWRIDDFRDLSKNDILVRSPTFQFNVDNNNNFKFEWRLYPNGQTESDKNWLSVYIYIYGLNHGNMTISISISILSKNNVIIRKVISKKVYNTDEEDESYWGFPQFVERDFILNDARNIFSDNKLTFQCCIKIHETDVSSNNESIKETDTKANESNYDNIFRLSQFDEFESLMNDEQFSDISFIIEDKTVRAHKAILARRSSVFAAMFQNQMRENLTSEVQIEDIKHDTFVEFLRFIYAGKVNDIEKISEELLYAAEKYDIEALKFTCLRTLYNNLSTDNVIKSLQLADKYNLDLLKTAGVNLIVMNKSKFINNPEFKLLMDMPKIMLDLCNKMLNENNDFPGLL